MFSRVDKASTSEIGSNAGGAASDPTLMRCSEIFLPGEEFLFGQNSPGQKGLLYRTDAGKDPDLERLRAAVVPRKS